MRRLWRDFCAAFWKAYEGKLGRGDVVTVPMKLGGVTRPVVKWGEPFYYDRPPVRVKLSGRREAVTHICEPGCDCPTAAMFRRVRGHVNKGTFN